MGTVTGDRLREKAKNCLCKVGERKVLTAATSRIAGIRILVSRGGLGSQRDKKAPGKIGAQASLKYATQLEEPFAMPGITSAGADQNRAK